MKKNIQTDHAIIAFFRENVFQILAIIFAVLGLWSYTKTLPIIHSVDVNKISITANAEEIKKKASKEVIETQLTEIADDIRDIKTQQKDLLDLYHELLKAE